MSVDYMVVDLAYRDYISHPTEEAARAWIKKTLDEYPDSCEQDFILYRRERLP